MPRAPQPLVQWTEQGADLLRLDQITQWTQEQSPEDAYRDQEIMRQLARITASIFSLRAQYHVLIKECRWTEQSAKVFADMQKLNDRLQSQMDMLADCVSFSPEGIQEMANTFTGVDRATFIMATTWTCFSHAILGEEGETENEIESEITTFVYVLMSVRKRLQDIDSTLKDWFSSPEVWGRGATGN